MFLQFHQVTWHNLKIMRSRPSSSISLLRRFLAPKSSCFQKSVFSHSNPAKNVILMSQRRMSTFRPISSRARTTTRGANAKSIIRASSHTNGLVSTPPHMYAHSYKLQMHSKCHFDVSKTIFCIFVSQREKESRFKVHRLEIKHEKAIIKH